jgi:CHAD domain-containing protein
MSVLGDVMGYSFTDHETVPEGMKRMACELLDKAIERAKPAGKNRDEAIHDARVAVKKLRALLRLARTKSNEDVFAKEICCHRKAGRLLSEVRDVTVMVAAFDGLTERYSDQLSSNAFTELRKPLIRRRNTQRSDEARALAEMARMLTAARSRVAKWPMDDDGFGTLRQGLKRSYRKGRLRMAQAQAAPSIETFHAWRKRVKDLWYQVRLLKPTWPTMLKKLADELESLADYLSEHHDLAILRHRVLQQSPDERTQLEALVALIDQRRGELEVEANRLATRLYVDSPKTFVCRFETYWCAWQAEAKVDPISIGEPGHGRRKAA